MKNEQWEHQARKRVSTTPTLKAHEETIFYDWSDWNEHMEWIATANEAEIVEWASRLERIAAEQGGDA